MALIRLNSRSIPDATITADDISEGAIEGALSQPTGRKNLIINGAMQVAQRGTSFTGIGNGGTGYTLDRFRFGEGGSPTYGVTVSQSSESPDGFASSLKYDVTTAQASLAASDQMRLDYFIEAQDVQQVAYGSSAPSTMTLSFYVRSNKTGTYIVYLSKDADSRQQTHTYTINSADTWERKTITIVGDTTGAINNDNGRGIFIGWTLASGTTYTSGTASSTWEASSNANRAAGLTVNLADSIDNEWYITGVQLEVGSVATPFEHRSYGEELSLCRRYFYTVGYPSAIEDGLTGKNFAVGYYLFNNRAEAGIPLPTPMRARPSLTQVSGSSYFQFYPGSLDAFDAWTGVNAPTNEFCIIYTSSGVSATQGMACPAAWNNDNARIFLDAEL